MARATYESLERAALRDLAARTVADPSAPSEHVESGRRYLLARGKTLEDAVEQIAGAIDLYTMQRVLDALNEPPTSDAAITDLMSRVLVDLDDTDRDALAELLGSIRARQRDRIAAR